MQVALEQLMRLDLGEKYLQGIVELGEDHLDLICVNKIIIELTGNRC